MKETDIEILRQIVSRTDKTGNEKIEMLIEFVAQQVKKLNEPAVSKSDSHEHGNTFCWINQEILLCKIRNNNFNTCRGCKHFKQNVC